MLSSADGSSLDLISYSHNAEVLKIDNLWRTQGSCGFSKSAARSHRAVPSDSLTAAHKGITGPGYGLNLFDAS